MKYQVSFFLLVVTSLCMVGSSSISVLKNAPTPSLDVECLAEHCLLQATECFANTACRTGAFCSRKCMDTWDQDTTSEKIHIQNCTNICAFTYQGPVYEKFITCMSDHQCMSLPPIPSQCRAPANITILKKLGPKDLNGQWWVVKGFHPVYDCYPCQHLSFQPLNSTTWSYKPRYQVYLENGSLALVEQEFLLPNSTPGDSISFHYHDVGLSHYETWWLLDAAEDKSYILLYYCGHTLQWYYDGALVLSRKTSLSDTDYSNIAQSYSKAVGLNTADFCNTTTTQCPD